MSDRRGRQQVSFARGVMGPRLQDRDDLEQFYQAASDGANTIALPEASARWRGGTRHQGRLRHKLCPIPFAAASVSTPNGGSASALADTALSTVSTTVAQSVNVFVVAQIDLGAASDISALDVLGVFSSLLTSDDALEVQTSLDGVTWSGFGGGLPVYVGFATNRRFALAPGEARTCRYIRVVINTTARLGAITVAGLRVWRERSTPGVVRFMPFAYSRNDLYQVVLTDRNIDVFADGVWQAAVPVPYRDFEVSEVTSVQSLDTLIAFHPSINWSIQRQGADARWTGHQQTYVNVPNQSEALRALGGEDARHKVAVAGIVPGDSFLLTIEDRHIAAVTMVADATQMASAIASAINAAAHVSGAVVTDVTATDDTLEFTVNFQGGSAARYWPATSIDVLSRDTAVATHTVVQDGRRVGVSVDVFGALTGWPRCGVLFQSRLWLGGPVALSNGLFASKLADFFNFDTTASAEDRRALFVALDADQSVTVQHLFAGRYLSAFANDSEWWVTSRTISGNTTPTFVQATDNGSRAGASPQMVQGGVYYVFADGETIGDFIYDSGSEDFVTDSASLLASHLIRDVVGIRHRPAHGQIGSSLVLGWNGDGTAFAISVMRSQETAGTTPWMHADGKFRALHVDKSRRIWAAVERPVSGVSALYLEEIDLNTQLDASVHQSSAVATSSVTGLAHLEGKEVWAWADGSPVGPFTVSGGAITLQNPASVVECGLLADVFMTSMPLMERLSDGTKIHRRKRVPVVVVGVVETGAIAVAANGQAARILTSARFGSQALDVAQADRLLTGDIVASSLLGSTVDGLVTVSRPWPGPWEIRSMLLEVA